MQAPSQWDVTSLKHHHFLLTLNDIDDAPLSPGDYLLVSTDNLTLYCPILLVNQKRAQAMVYADSMTLVDVEKHLSQAGVKRVDKCIPNFALKKPLLIFCQHHVFAQMVFYLQRHRHAHDNIMLLGETTRALPFALIPSQLLLPQNPIQEMMGSVQLLEDWSVCARFCGIENAGYGDGSVSQILDQWSDIIHPAYPTDILLAGKHSFVHSCQQKLSLTSDSFLNYILEI